MLRYLYAKEIFSEIPGEITLGISISGCIIRCKGCHSRELWEDKGTVLGLTELQWLLSQHKGISCLLLLGGEHDIPTLTELFKYAYQKVTTAWYCGLDILPKDKQSILQHLDYIKLGHYDPELGPLISPTTNQRFYHVEHIPNGTLELIDQTYKFHKDN